MKGRAFPQSAEVLQVDELQESRIPSNPISCRSEELQDSLSGSALCRGDSIGTSGVVPRLAGGWGSVSPVGEGASTPSWAGERKQLLGAGEGCQLCCRCWGWQLSPLRCHLPHASGNVCDRIPVFHVPLPAASWAFQDWLPVGTPKKKGFLLNYQGVWVLKPNPSAAA